jgi:hypothetical protein
MGDYVFFIGDGQGFSSFTGAVEGKGVQENFQTSYLQNRKRPHHTAKD